jgi:L-alanine-DL-glutamate epimerase-like enolase superfamily enzyme
MRIARISTAVIESNFDWVIVKIETDEEITGYGEAYFAPAVSAVIREFGTVLAGEDATSIDRIVRRMRGMTAYCSRGVVSHAIGGIETALLDCIGKRHNMPVWQLLGGKYRDSIPIYADCHAGESLESITPLLKPRTPAWMRGSESQPERDSVISLKHHGWDASEKRHTAPEAFAGRAQQMAKRGFRMLKFDVDVPTPYETDEYNRNLSAQEVDYAAALVRGVREAVGPGIGLAIDCHWNYNVDSAIALARALEPVRLLWLEDPLPADNIAALGEVQRHTETTIATGENHYTRVDFEQLIDVAKLRVLAPDVQKIGVWEGKKLADMADSRYVNLTWHNVSGPIGTIAGVHLAAATPNLLALEWHAASVPFFDELAKNAPGPMIEQGRIRVPDAAGLGIELDETVAHRYRKPGEPFFE